MQQRQLRKELQDRTGQGNTRQDKARLRTAQVVVVTIY